MGNIPYLTLDNRRSVKEMFSFRGKTVLITGAAGQIGFLSAAGFAEMGADVILADLASQTNTEQMAADISSRFDVRATFLGVDVAKMASVQELFAGIEREFGALDAVHSNIGHSFAQDTSFMSPEVWDKTLAINTRGTLLVNQCAMELMRKHGTKGAIVNTASMSGHIINRLDEPNLYEIAYPVSKAGVRHLTKALAMEYVRYGIRVNCISPGYVYSATHERSSQERLDSYIKNIPMKRFATAEEMTGAVLYLASDLASYATGTDLVVDGGYTVW